MLNQKIKDFIEKNQDLTILGLAWAIYWRVYVCAFAFGVIMMTLVAMFD